MDRFTLDEVQQARRRLPPTTCALALQCTAEPRSGARDISFLQRVFPPTPPD